MSLVPQTQRDQIKFLIGFVAVALAAAYYVYPYGSREEQLEIDLARVAQLDEANQRAARDVASGSLQSLRIQAAEHRSAQRSGDNRAKLFFAVMEGLAAVSGKGFIRAVAR